MRSVVLEVVVVVPDYYDGETVADEIDQAIQDSPRFNWDKSVKVVSEGAIDSAR